MVADGKLSDVQNVKKKSKSINLNFLLFRDKFRCQCVQFLNDGSSVAQEDVKNSIFCSVRPTDFSYKRVRIINGVIVYQSLTEIHLNTKFFVV